MGIASAVWSQPWILRLLARERLQLFRRIQPLIGNRQDIYQVVQGSLMCSTFRTWGFRQFGQFSRAQIDDHLKVKGMELLEQHYAQQPDKGLVLANSHFGASRVISFYLQLLGYRITSLESHGLLSALGVRGADNINVLEMGFDTKFFLKHVYHARKALLDGQIFHLASDGYQGTSGDACEFHSKLRHFARGFSELAVRTGSPVYTVFASVRPDGTLMVDIDGPLDAGNPDAGIDSRVNTLIHGYISALEKRWSEDLGNVHVSHVRRYLALPTAVAEGEAATADSVTG